MTKYIIALISILICTSVMGQTAPQAHCPKVQRPTYIQRPQVHCPKVQRPVYIQRPVYVQPNCNRYYYQRPRISYYSSYQSKTRYCSEYKVQLYSGGQMVGSWTAAGRVNTRTSSDGIRYYFTEKYTGKLVEISGSAGNVVITQR